MILQEVYDFHRLWKFKESKIRSEKYAENLEAFVPKKAYAAQTYIDQKTLELNVILAANTHTNYSSMCVVLPIQIMKKTGETKNIDGTLITVL